MNLMARAEIRRARIEMIPLMDCIFLLLTFFIYACLSMTLHRGIPVTLPAATTSALEKQTRTTITITAEGKLYLDKEPITLDQLVKSIKTKQQADKKLMIFMNADKDAHVSMAINVLDALRKNGIGQVTFLTAPRSAEAP